MWKKPYKNIKTVSPIRQYSKLTQKAPKQCTIWVIPDESWQLLKSLVISEIWWSYYGPSTEQRPHAASMFHTACCSYEGSLQTNRTNKHEYSRHTNPRFSLTILTPALKNTVMGRATFLSCYIFQNTEASKDRWCKWVTFLCLYFLRIIYVVVLSFTRNSSDILPQSYHS